MSKKVLSSIKPVCQVTSGVESGKAVAVSAFKAEMLVALKKVTKVEWAGLAAGVMMMTLIGMMGYGAGKALEEQQKALQSLSVRLDEAADIGVSLKGEIAALRLTLVAVETAEELHTRREELQTRRLDGLSLMAGDGAKKVAALEGAVDSNAKNTAVELATIRNGVAGAAEVGRAGLLVSSQMGCLIGSSMLGEKVREVAKAMAPMVEPVSWYNPTAEVIAPTAPIAEVPAPMPAPMAEVPPPESWTARMRSRLAATLLAK